MSSSTFEVRESESDSEKVLDFELDSCEENGIMSTSIEGELPKDHTYTKEPDVLEDDLREINDSGSAANEEDAPSSPEKSSRSSRSSRSKAPAKKSPAKSKAKKAAPAKKAASAKKEPVSRKGKSGSRVSKEETSAEEPTAESAGEVTPNGNVEEVAEESPKPIAKRGRKRKVEEKEEEQDAEEPVVEEPEKKSPAKKQATKAKKAPKAAESSKKKANVGEVTDNNNLPIGWVRKSVTRQSGKSAGMIDVYIYSPDGVKFRSKPEIATYLMKTKSNLKLELFDFSKKASSADSPMTSKKKAAAAKPKQSPKKKQPASPKKNSTLLVKIVQGKNKKGSTKKSPEKSVNKAAPKGKKGAKAPAKKGKE